MSCSFHIQERQTDVIVFGGNKQRKSKYDRHVMTDLMIFRFGREINILTVLPNVILFCVHLGSVRKLEELCKLTVRQNWTLFEHSMACLPQKIVQFIDCDESDYEIVYPSASDFC